MENIVQEIYMPIQVLLAFLAGAVVGWEREHRGAHAGIRTFGYIAMGACVYGLISRNVPFPGDPSRIASQVAIGVGFIGAGLIFRKEEMIGGLTTAATLWCTAAIGLAIAFGMYFIAITSTIIVFVFLRMPTTKLWHSISAKKKKFKQMDD